MKSFFWLCSLSLSLFVDTVQAQIVYQRTDQSGGVIFSDKPQQGSQKIEIKPLQTFSQQSTSFMSTSPSSEKELLDSKRLNEVEYRTLAITAPLNRETIWSNSGDVTIKIVLEPELKPGDQWLILLDGKVVKQSRRLMHVKVSNIERGKHTLVAQVISKQGKLLKSSAEVLFYIKQASINMPGRQ